MKALLSIMICLLSVPAYAQSGAIGYASSSRLTLTEEQSDHISSDNAFALDLFKRLNRRSGGENFLFSPIGVTTALGLSLNAAGGQTRDQIRDVLGHKYSDEEINQYYSFLAWSLERKEGFKLGLYNSLWVDEGIEVSPQFIKTITEPYLGSVHEVDMGDSSAVGQINSWIGERGRGASSIATSTFGEGGVLLVNSVRLQGTWRRKFEQVDNYRGTFRPGSGAKPYQVDYMQSLIEFPYYDDIPNGMHYAEFPFVDQNPLRAVSIVIFMPRKSKNIDNMIEKHFNAKRWKEMMWKLYPRRLKVRMPMFDIRSDISLKEVLNEVGATKLFTPNAQMTALSGSDVFINDIIQKTSIDIDHDGVEAMAVTIVTRAGVQQPGSQTFTPFFIDGPFVFVVRDRNTGVILSMGKVMNID